jgi:hypothetical protein
MEWMPAISVEGMGSIGRNASSANRGQTLNGGAACGAIASALAA